MINSEAAGHSTRRLFLEIGWRRSELPLVQSWESGLNRIANDLIVSAHSAIEKCPPQESMGFSEFESARYRKIISEFVENNRPAAHVRENLDFGFRIVEQSVELFEIRADWRDPKEKIEEPAAKATYVKKTSRWNVYWQRADLKWHRYEPYPDVQTIEEFLELVKQMSMPASLAEHLLPALSH